MVIVLCDMADENTIDTNVTKCCHSITHICIQYHSLQRFWPCAPERIHSPMQAPKQSTQECCSDITAKAISTHCDSDNGIDCTDIVVSCAGDDFQLNTRMVCARHWPHMQCANDLMDGNSERSVDGVGHNMWLLVHAVQNATKHSDNVGPIMVIDDKHGL
jgi:hypothetical protein